MALEFIKLIKGGSPVAQVGNLGFFKLSTDTGGGGGDATFSRIFSENTPATISAISAEISANNMTSSQVAEIYGWNIGDTITIPLTTGENIEMRIIGFNHDTLSDGTGTAGITLEMVNCLATKYKFNSKASNSGGYSSSYLKSTEIPLIIDLLPQELRDVIKLVNKKSSKGYNSYVGTTSEDLFILSGVELCGVTNIVKYQIEGGEDEGEQYEYYTLNNNDASRIKYYDADGDGISETATNYHTRSVSQSSSVFVVRCLSNGTLNANADPSYATGLSFAFCI